MDNCSSVPDVGTLARLATLRGRQNETEVYETVEKSRRLSGRSVVLLSGSCEDVQRHALQIIFGNIPYDEARP